MKNLKTNEVNLVRSRALTVLFSMILSALILFPFIAGAKGKKEAKSEEMVYMHALQQNAHAAVTIANIGEGKYELSVESRDGDDIYYNEYLTSVSQFSKVFDFSKLEDGDYTFKLNTRSGLKERHFVVKDGEIQVNYAREIKPSFSSTGHKALVEFENALENDVMVSVYNVAGEELVSKTIKKEEGRKFFDFSEVVAGEYKIVVYSGNKEYAFNYEK